MNLTAYELGQRSPAEFLSRGNRPKGRAPLPAAEKARRLAIIRSAREQMPSICALARAIEQRDGNVHQWLSGKRPVPAKHLPALERIAGGDA